MFIAKRLTNIKHIGDVTKSKSNNLQRLIYLLAVLKCQNYHYKNKQYKKHNKGLDGEKIRIVL